MHNPNLFKMGNQIKVVVKRIEPQTVELFDPQDNSLGFVNEYELGDVKIQIAKHKLSGYYVKFEERKIRIGVQGTLEDYPKGFFDTTFNHSIELFEHIKESIEQITK